jgi:hypothetical protein
MRRTPVYFCNQAPAEDPGDEDVTLTLTMGHDELLALIRKLKRESRKRGWVVQFKLRGVLSR